jgi:hypothetical protein
MVSISGLGTPSMRRVKPELTSSQLLGGHE